ncbi:MAG: hypothetical protein J2P57_22540, partial [Acidimicrobiaceae bacterium]|nr:hypothetical protein [Acidimicrobiaceae bacterium]
MAASIVGHASSFVESNGLRAIILGAVWVGAIVGVDFALRLALQRYEKRVEERDATVFARRRTTLSVLRRVTVVLL